MKKLITTLCLCLIGLFTYAQEIDLGTNIIPPSPNASAIAQYAAHPVSLSTGTMSPSISLENLSSTTLSIPINLSYHASGIRTNQEASNVGLGWALNAGGSITRSVYGKPDELNLIGYHNLASVDLSLIDWQDAVENGWDLEPDVYHFNFNGKSGKFIIDRDQVVRFYEPNRMSIVKNNEGKWKIIDTDGIEYLFEITEESFQFTEDGESFTFISAWHLTKIKHPNLDEINLFYDNLNLYNRVNSNSYSQFISTDIYNDCISSLPLCQSGTVQASPVSEISIEQRNLTRIESRTHKMVIQYESRDDLLEQERIKSIHFKTLSDLQLKEYSFNYDYFGSGNSKRLKLLGIQEKNGTDALPPFIFSYDLGQVVKLNSNSVDHWGYQNGTPNTTSHLSYPFTYEDKKEFYNKKRKSDTNALNGILTRIDYPTGQFNEFTYELHNYSKLVQDFGVIESVQMSELQQIQLVCDMNATCNESDNFNITAGYETIVMSVEFNNCPNNECDTEVTIVNTSTGNIQYFNVLNLGTPIEIELIPGNYSITLENFYPQAFDFLLEYEQAIENPTASDYPEAGGARIKTITDNEGSRSFDYSETVGGISSGILLNSPQYIDETGSPVKCQLSSGCTECDGFTINSVSVASYLSGSHVFYKEVKEIQKDNSYEKTIFGFVPDERYQITDKRPRVPYSSQEQLRGKPIYQATYRADNTIANEMYYSYSDHLEWTGEVHRISFLGSFCWLQANTNKYKHFTQYQQLDSSISKTYDQYGSNFIEANTSYIYDTDYNLISQTTSTNSESTTKNIKYAKQVYSNAHFLKDRNMISIPLEIEVDGVQGVKTEYKSLNGVNPFRQYSKVIGTDYTQHTKDLFGWKWMVEIKSYVNGMPKEIEQRGIQYNQIINWLSGDNFGQMDNVTQGTRITDYSYNEKRQLVSTTNFNGLTNTYGYDDLNRLHTVDEFGKTYSTINYLYDAVNGGDNKVTTTVAFGAIIKESETIYDVFGRDVQNVLKHWTPQGNDMIISKSYNLSGQITDNCDPRNGSCETATYEDISNGRLLLSAFDGWNGQTTYEHLVNIATINANNINYAPGTLNLIVSIDENGQVSKSYTNMFNKTILDIKIIENDEEVQTTYSYDPKQNITSITNANNDVYSYTYYDDGSLKVKTVPQGGTTSYTYDEAGQIITSNLPNGDVLSYSYNFYNQLEIIRLNGVMIKDRDYFYSGVGNGQIQSEKKYLLNDLSQFVIKEFSYDSYGRIHSTTTTGIDGLSSQLITNYDNRDLAIDSQTEILKNGFVDQNIHSIFVYDTQGRLFTEHMTVNSGNQELISRNGYFEQGWLKEMNIGSGCLQSVDYLYNSRGWLTNINDKLVQSDDPISVIMQQDFGDAGGSLTTNVTILMNVSDVAEGNPTSVKIKTELSKIDFDNGQQLQASMENRYMIHGAAITNQYEDIVQFTIQGFYDRTTYVQTLQNRIKQEVLPFNPTFDPDVLTPIDEETYGIFPGPTNGGNDPDSECSEDLFFQGLFYEQGNTALNADPQLNGNIAWMNWKVPGTNENVQAVEPSAYGFTYDKLNRITNAKYNEPDYFDVSISYDDHIGNIDLLSRYGYNPVINQYELIDQLNYSYTDGLLTSVFDDSNQDVGAKTSEYSFNTTTGNLESSADIESIDYNYLNLPNVVFLKNNVKIYYSYDADGTLWKRQVVDKENTRTYHYINEVSYENMALEYIGSSNGRYISTEVEAVNGTEIIEGYQYVINDHLGSGRVWFMDRDNSGSIERTEISNEITQIEHYYPFGMSMNAPQVVNSIDPENRFKYNGKEFQEDWGAYNYDARFYMPSIAKWTTVDPLASIMPNWSAYNYTFNNPIIFIDPDGRMPNPHSQIKMTKGFIKGVGNALKGTWNFVTSDAWKGSTWKNLGNASLGTFANLTNRNSNGAKILDKSIGTNTEEMAHIVLDNLTVSAKRIIAGDVEHLGELAGEATVGIVGPKGVSSIKIGSKAGIVYRRIDHAEVITKPYAGQAKSMERFIKRQKEHARAHPDSDFSFEIIDRANPNGSFPTKLDKAEQKALDKLGGPTNKSNPNGGASNKKNVIKKN